MKRYLIASIVAGAAVAVIPASAAAVTITVEPEPFNNSFAPATSTLDLGEGGFDWEWGPDGTGAADVHNVIQGKSFASGKPLFDSGEAVTDVPGGFSVTASAGSFPYYCEVHLGMVGEVAVRPVGSPKRKAVRLSWASAETTTGNRFDVRYRAGKKWKTWKKKTKKPGGTFGRKGKPVKLGKKAVKVQARSRAGKARSDWSPTLKLAR